MHWAAVVIALVGLVTASPAGDAKRLACDLEGGGSEAYQERLAPLLAEAAEEAHAVLGDQIAGYWLSNRDQGWDMGVAPGPLTVEQAHAAIAERLEDRFAPEDAEYMAGALHLYDMPYSDAELRRVEAELRSRLDAAVGNRIFWVVQRGCLDGEAWRVEVGLYDDATAEDVAQVRALVAAYGDMVRLYLDGLVTPPSAGAAGPAARLRAFVRMPPPKRCVNGRTIALRTRANARGVIRRAAVTARGRRRALTAEPVTVRLVRSGITKVLVVVRVGDGSRLAHTYRYRRC
jgi:hypothetical protein